MKNFFKCFSLNSRPTVSEASPLNSVFFYLNLSNNVFVFLTLTNLLFVFLLFNNFPGPYWCAMNSLSVAISSCMVSPSLINPNYLQQITRNTAISGYADSADNLSNDRVYLFSGKNDRTVVQGN